MALNAVTDVPADFSLVLQHVSPLAPLVFLMLLYCTGLLLVLGNIYFLYSCHCGVTLLVPLNVWCIFPLSLPIVVLSGLDWEVSDLCP